MEFRAFMGDMIRTELEDVVGVENVSTEKTERMTYGVDYFWISRMSAPAEFLPRKLTAFMWIPFCRPG